MSAGIIDGNVQGLYVASLTFDPASVATITCAEQDFTVPGVRPADILLNFNMQTNTAGLGVAGFRVKSANTISVNFVNPTAGAIDKAAVAVRMVFARPDADMLGGLPT